MSEEIKKVSEETMVGQPTTTAGTSVAAGSTEPASHPTAGVEAAGSADYQEIILARLGEITLKGLNRRRFEQRLIKNLAHRLRHFGSFEVTQSQSRIWIVPQTPEAAARIEEAMHTVTDVFGIVSASPVRRFDGGLDELRRQAVAYVRDEIKPRKGMTFKVESRRGNKQFPLGSQDISAEIGGSVLEAFPMLRVNVREPDFILHCEVRDQLYVYSRTIPGLRGLPVGMSGRGMLLLSGGIDSPVAGFMMASRGVELEAIYFHTFPYTGDRAKEKVIDLARILTKYTGRIRLHIVDFTDTQLKINMASPADMLTIVMRRVMLRVAERLAEKMSCQSLITGESMGQVASQTMEAIHVTNDVVRMPIFRPLIGLDKDATVELARKIGTFETSILPYEDCCTVFVAKHPKTRPTIPQAEAAERELDLEAMVEACMGKIECVLLKYGE